ITSYQDTGATGVVAYAYRVRSFNANGYSAYTNTVTNAAMLTAPQAIAVNFPGSGGSGQTPQGQSSSQSVTAGSNVTLSATASGATGYQWQYDGANIDGATNSTLSIANFGTIQAGSYSAKVTTSSGTVSSAPATVAVNVYARLINLSARAFVGTGSQVLVAGFVDTGSAPLQLLVRGDGPALTAFGVAGVLPDPSISLFDSSSAVIATDTGWGNTIIPGSSTSGVTVQPATSSIF